MSWLDNLEPLEIKQMKLVYAGVYIVLGLIPRSLVDYKHLKKPSVKGLTRSDAKRFPALQKLVSIGDNTIWGVDKAKALAKWRWMCRDNPDKVIARYIRQFPDSKKAILAIFKGIKLLCTEIDLEKLLLTPEAELAKQKGYELNHKKGVRMISGVEKRGKVINVFRASAHDASAQSKEEMRVYSLLMYELTQRVVQEECDGALFIYDLTDMKRKNADPAITRFILNNLNNIYPGLAAYTYFHNAPGFFEMFFRAASTFLSKKVPYKFTKTLPDLLQNVTIENLSYELGGYAENKYQWTPPKPDDDLPLKNTYRQKELRAERLSMLKNLEEDTKAWVMIPDATRPQERIDLLSKLEKHYLISDKYFRHRTHFDRIGLVEKLRPTPHEAPDGDFNSELNSGQGSKTTSVTSVDEPDNRTHEEITLRPIPSTAVVATTPRKKHIASFVKAD